MLSNFHNSVVAVDLLKERLTPASVGSVVSISIFRFFLYVRLWKVVCIWATQIDTYTMNKCCNFDFCDISVSGLLKHITIISTVTLCHKGNMSSWLHVYGSLPFSLRLKQPRFLLSCHVNLHSFTDNCKWQTHVPDRPILSLLQNCVYRWHIATQISICQQWNCVTHRTQQQTSALLSDSEPNPCLHKCSIPPLQPIWVWNSSFRKQLSTMSNKCCRMTSLKIYRHSAAWWERRSSTLHVTQGRLVLEKYFTYHNEICDSKTLTAKKIL